MAQRYLVPNMGMPAVTMAPAIVSLAPDLLQDFDLSSNQDLFQMDDSELMLEDDNLDTLGPLLADVDQARVCYRSQSCWQPLTMPQECACVCAQFARVETGSAYRSLAEQLPVPPVKAPTRSMVVQSSWMGSSSAGQTMQSMQHSASVPQTIARPMDTPSIAVSHWPQHVSYPSQLQHTDAPYYSLDLLFNGPPTDTVPNSFQSTTLSGMPWSEAQEFQCLGWPEADLGYTATAPSSFDVETPFLSNPPSFSSPKMVRPPVYEGEELGHIDDLQQVDPVFEKRILTTTPLAGTNVSSWARGTYNVSDRTNFGKLVQPGIAPPGPKKRKVAQSNAGSSTSLSCGGCGKVFASKSEKE